MIAKLQPNRVRRTYLGGGRIDAFTGAINCAPPAPAAHTGGAQLVAPDMDGVPRPEDWLASTTTAFNGTLEIEGEGLGRLEDGRLVKDVVGTLPILVKLLDSDERLVIQAHPTVPCAKRLFNSSVGKTECWYFLPGTAPDACVYLGFKPGITRELWERAVLGGSQLVATAAGAINCAPPAAEKTGAINCAPPVRQILGPELTDKFAMWRVTNGGRVALPRDRAVAVVTEGAGEVNGLAVKTGDRLVVADERQLAVSGTVALVVCA